MANETFTSEVTSITGYEVSAKVRDFDVTLDEPVTSAGTNKGMNPIEALLTALGSCQVMTAKGFAKAKGINLNNIRVNVDGVIDLDGFLGKNPDAKIGFSKLISTFYIDADNTDEEIQDFVDFINATCPVHDTIENTPEFETKIAVFE
ncbi:OsmC family protein [Companilactobacillus mishanensis]|uniref:OsmC family protein n=1 Tax=Companilactobacillus mishanensis TaxID=2486008 RepID=UPI001295D38A|nr:OsmC family protein [Companilactobacillus mishanensis]MQS89197.1 OsmC family protein [Companilactobacillus mishanensis]